MLFPADSQGFIRLLKIPFRMVEVFVLLSEGANFLEALLLQMLFSSGRFELSYCAFSSISFIKLPIFLS